MYVNLSFKINYKIKSRQHLDMWIYSSACICMYVCMYVYVSIIELNILWMPVNFGIHIKFYEYLKCPLTIFMEGC